MNGRNDTHEIDDDGFYTCDMGKPVDPDEYICPRCMGTGYRRDWRGQQVRCDDCWSDNGPE